MPISAQIALLHICCHRQQLGQLEFTELSDLFFNSCTSPPSSKHVGRNKDITVFSILATLCTDWKNQWLFTKTANVYAISGIVHHPTLGIPRSTEGWLKMLGSGIVLMMTPKSKLSRHRSKCAGHAGMHQSAEPIKDSFHWSSTPLLTLCLAVRAGGSVACQPLTV